jgi:hypothetical protein
MMIRSLIMLLAVIASGILVTSLINPIGHTLQQQQYVFAQENSTIVSSSSSSSNKISTNATFFAQIHKKQKMGSS